MAPQENPTVYTSGQQGDLTLCRAEISEKDVIAQQPLQECAGRAVPPAAPRRREKQVSSFI